MNISKIINFIEKPYPSNIAGNLEYFIRADMAGFVRFYRLDFDVEVQTPIEEGLAWIFLKSESSFSQDWISRINKLRFETKTKKLLLNFIEHSESLIKHTEYVKEPHLLPMNADDLTNIENIYSIENIPTECGPSTTFIWETEKKLWYLEAHYES